MPETDSDSGSSLAFVPDEDFGSEGCGQCDTWGQDCPDGSKCAYWYSETWEECRSCMIPGPQSPGESCMNSGNNDTCDISSWCYPAGLGFDVPSICVEFCDGTPDDPGDCSDPDMVCAFGSWYYYDAVGCRPRCDPSMPDPCPVDERCALDLPAQRDFACVFIEVSVAPGEPCNQGADCDGGLCVDAIDLPECEDDDCCASLCDTLAPDCPLGTECVLIEVDDVDSTVGACQIPP